MEIGIFANESDDNFLGSRDLDNEYESEYLVRLESKKSFCTLILRHSINLLHRFYSCPPPQTRKRPTVWGRRTAWTWPRRPPGSRPASSRLGSSSPFSSQVESFIEKNKKFDTHGVFHEDFFSRHDIDLGFLTVLSKYFQSPWS